MATAKATKAQTQLDIIVEFVTGKSGTGAGAINSEMKAIEGLVRNFAANMGKTTVNALGLDPAKSKKSVGEIVQQYEVFQQKVQQIIAALSVLGGSGVGDQFFEKFTSGMRSMSNAIEQGFTKRFQKSIGDLGKLDVRQGMGPLIRQINRVSNEMSQAFNAGLIGGADYSKLVIAFSKAQAELEKRRLAYARKVENDGRNENQRRGQIEAAAYAEAYSRAWKEAHQIQRDMEARERKAVSDFKDIYRKAKGEAKVYYEAWNQALKDERARNREAMADFNTARRKAKAEAREYNSAWNQALKDERARNQEALADFNKYRRKAKAEAKAYNDAWKEAIKENQVKDSAASAKPAASQILTIEKQAQAALLAAQKSGDQQRIQQAQAGYQKIADMARASALAQVKMAQALKDNNVRLAREAANEIIKANNSAGEAMRDMFKPAGGGSPEDRLQSLMTLSYQFTHVGFQLQMLSDMMGSVFESPLKNLAELEKELGFVSALFTRTDVTLPLEKARKAALDLSQSSLFTQIDVAKGMKTLALAGLDATQVLENIKPVLEFATAGMMDVDAAAKMAVSTTTAFGAGIGRMSEVMNILAKAANVSNTDLSAMSTAFKQLGPQAAQIGASVKETAMDLALLSKAGLEAGPAATQLRGMYRVLAQLATGTAPKGVQESFDKMGIAIKDASGEFLGMENIINQFNDKLKSGGQSGIDALGKIIELFKQRGGSTGILALMKLQEEALKKGSSAWTEMSEAMRKIASPAELAAIRMGDLYGATTKLKNSWEALKTSIGGIMADSGMTQLLNFLAGAVQGVRSLVEASSGVSWLLGVLLNFGAVVGVIVGVGASLVKLGGIVAATWELFAASGPVASLVAHLTAIAPAATAAGTAIAASTPAWVALSLTIGTIAAAAATILALFRLAAVYFKQREDIKEYEDTLNRATAALKKLAEAGRGKEDPFTSSLARRTAEYGKLRAQLDTLSSKMASMVPEMLPKVEAERQRILAQMSDLKKEIDAQLKNAPIEILPKVNDKSLGKELDAAIREGNRITDENGVEVNVTVDKNGVIREVKDVVHGVSKVLSKEELAKLVIHPDTRKVKAEITIIDAILGNTKKHVKAIDFSKMTKDVDEATDGLAKLEKSARLSAAAGGTLGRDLGGALNLSKVKLEDLIGTTGKYAGALEGMSDNAKAAVGREIGVLSEGNKAKLNLIREYFATSMEALNEYAERVPQEEEKVGEARQKVFNDVEQALEETYRDAATKHAEYAQKVIDQEAKLRDVRVEMANWVKKQFEADDSLKTGEMKARESIERIAELKKQRDAEVAAGQFELAAKTQQDILKLSEQAADAQKKFYAENLKKRTEIEKKIEEEEKALAAARQTREENLAKKREEAEENLRTVRERSAENLAEAERKGTHAIYEEKKKLDGETAEARHAATLREHATDEAARERIRSASVAGQRAEEDAKKRLLKIQKEEADGDTAQIELKEKNIQKLREELAARNSIAQHTNTFNQKAVETYTKAQAQRKGGLDFEMQANEVADQTATLIEEAAKDAVRIEELKLNYAKIYHDYYETRLVSIGDLSGKIRDIWADIGKVMANGADAFYGGLKAYAKDPLSGKPIQQGVTFVPSHGDPTTKAVLSSIAGKPLPPTTATLNVNVGGSDADKKLTSDLAALRNGTYNRDVNVKVNTTATGPVAPATLATLTGGATVPAAVDVKVGGGLDWSKDPTALKIAQAAVDAGNPLGTKVTIDADATKAKRSYEDVLMEVNKLNDKVADSFDVNEKSERAVASWLKVLDIQEKAAKEIALIDSELQKENITLAKQLELEAHRSAVLKVEEQQIRELEYSLSQAQQRSTVLTAQIAGMTEKDSNITLKLQTDEGAFRDVAVRLDEIKRISAFLASQKITIPVGMDPLASGVIGKQFADLIVELRTKGTLEDAAKRFGNDIGQGLIVGFRETKDAIITTFEATGGDAILSADQQATKNFHDMFAAMPDAAKKATSMTQAELDAFNAKTKENAKANGATALSTEEQYLNARKKVIEEFNQYQEAAVKGITAAEAREWDARVKLAFDKMSELEVALDPSKKADPLLLFLPDPEQYANKGVAARDAFIKGFVGGGGAFRGAGVTDTWDILTPAPGVLEAKGAAAGATLQTAAATAVAAAQPPVLIPPAAAQAQGAAVAKDIVTTAQATVAALPPVKLNVSTDDTADLMRRMQTAQAEAAKYSARIIELQESVARSSKILIDAKDKIDAGTKKSLEMSIKDKTDLIAMGQQIVEQANRNITMYQTLIDKTRERAALEKTSQEEQIARDRQRVQLAEASQRAAEAEARARASNRPGGMRWGGLVGGMIRGMAEGGHLPGYGGGDRRLTLLEDGEYVLPKEAVRAVGVGFLDRLRRSFATTMSNFSLAVPRMAGGGAVAGSGTQGTYVLDLKIGNMSHPLTGSKQVITQLLEHLRREGMMTR